MAVAGLDFAKGGLMGLAAVNLITEVGGTDTTVSGNATIALLQAAIRALPRTVGSGPNAQEQVARGLGYALNVGAVASTHTATTIAGLAAIIQASLAAAGVNADLAFSGFMPQ